MRALPWHIAFLSLQHHFYTLHCSFAYNSSLINIVLFFHANNILLWVVYTLSTVVLTSSVVDWYSTFPCRTQYNLELDDTTKDETFI